MCIELADFKVTLVYRDSNKTLIRQCKCAISLPLNMVITFKLYVNAAINCNKLVTILLLYNQNAIKPADSSQRQDVQIPWASRRRIGLC